MSRELEPAYVAGFFDGEGSVGIYSSGSSRGRTLRAQITQNTGLESDALLRQLADQWGASLTYMNRKTSKPAWIWQASGANAVAFLQWIRPWLLLKKNQVDLAVDWHNTRPVLQRDVRGRIVAREQAQIEYDDSVAKRLKSMKREGWCA